MILGIESCLDLRTVFVAVTVGLVRETSLALDGYSCDGRLSLNTALAVTWWLSIPFVHHINITLDAPVNGTVRVAQTHFGRI